MSDTSKLIEARRVMELALDEISWYVSRKKNLGAKTEDGRIWADVLNEDLDVLREGLKATA